MKFMITTLGCKVNQHESQLMREQLIRQGMLPAEEGQQPDVYIVNSCTVTATADQKTRQLIHRARRQYPEAVVCLTGCMPQAFPEKAQELSEVDVLLGNSNREVLHDSIMQYISSGEQVVCIQPHDSRSGLHGGIACFEERTRACIKIEDGCNRFCAYCIIPYARGRVRSRPLEDIRQEAELLSKQCAELVLVGINLSAYGQDCGMTLADAVREVAAVEGVKRIRLGSLEPDLLTPELLDYLAAEPKFCPQFHMSVQSGCDATLQRMGRRYDTAQYLALAESIRERFPNASITTDIMVGFPGETDEEFEQTLDFVRRAGFARAHCFIYSRRPGTRAAEFPAQVQPDTAKARSARLIAATNYTASQFMRSQIGTRAAVLVERVSEDGVAEGYTENYTQVRISNAVQDLTGTIVEVTITAADGDVCTAELT
ncbi:MAG: tRNA (N(6)-L-threonylcarbamoyladenosine(37)-C(2))-methylthiotransferase MtaB [Ruminococcaceae bacterium]|nr:tRNA (N(6)-L-threonylcarbamoyladenosine(37)-C(2))-methylthiotransferase MtaB [Oscillospiraceae bacterium]